MHGIAFAVHLVAGHAGHGRHRRGRRILQLPRTFAVDRMLLYQDRDHLSAAGRIS
jgi:hypothetical protein